MMAREGVSESAAILAGAVSLIVTGVTVLRYEYKKHELEKHKKEIAAIQELYKRHLERIEVVGYKDAKKVKLPPIFDEGTEEAPTPTAILQIEVLEDLYKKVPLFSDPHLESYGHHVLNAMRKLAEFYNRRIVDRGWFHRGDKNDITSATLSYLILMLSEHGVKFEGYSVDIAYLNALAEFVNAFASIEKGNHEERFEQLTEAYNELQKARDILIDHSTSLSMEELICQFVSDSSNATDSLIRLFAKLTLPHEQWHAVDFTRLDNLALGVVQPEYKYADGNSRTVFHNAILLPDCIFSRWIKSLANDYVASLPVTKGLELSIGGTRYQLPDLTDKKNEKIYSEIEAVFKKSSHVLTTTVQAHGKNAATKDFIPVTQEAEVARRAGIYFDLYQLTDRIRTAKYFCSHIWREIKKLGERYVTRSHECDFIFQVLQGLGEQIEDSAAKILKSLEQLEAEEQGAMHPAQAHSLKGRLRQLLSCAQTEIPPAIAAIVNKHNSSRRNVVVGKPAVFIGKKEDPILMLSEQICSTYGIDTGHPVVKTEEPAVAAAVIATGAPVPTAPAPVSPVALEKAKSKRRENPKIDALYCSLYTMRHFGEALRQKDLLKGEMVFQLVNELEDMTDDFLSKIDVSKSLTKLELTNFERVFLAKLHSKDTEMAVHRAQWKPLVANIAIAFTGLGLLLLLAKLIHSSLNGHASLFFSHTRRQQHVAQVDASLQQVLVAAPAA